MLSVKSGGKSYRLVPALSAGCRDELERDAAGLAQGILFPRCSPNAEPLAGETHSNLPSHLFKPLPPEYEEAFQGCQWRSTPSAGLERSGLQQTRLGSRSKTWASQQIGGSIGVRKDTESEMIGSRSFCGRGGRWSECCA